MPGARGSLPDVRSSSPFIVRRRSRGSLPRLNLKPGLSTMPLFIYRCPTTGYRVEGFSAEDASEDRHTYEPVTCPVCHQVHYVNPVTGAVSGATVESDVDH
jgi:hypothetical protein